MASSPRWSARARILDAADRLFYEQGVRAVGVEAIVAAADTAKTTLYGHFGSKDGLVVAYLERRAAAARARLEGGLTAHGGPPVERLLHVYDLLSDELAEPGYRGSPFVNACVELGNDHPAAAVAQAHRRWLREIFACLAAAARAPEPEALAALLLHLYEAAMVAAQIDGDAAAARTARSTAAALLTPPSLGPDTLAGPPPLVAAAGGPPPATVETRAGPPPSGATPPGPPPHADTAASPPAGPDASPGPPPGVDTTAPRRPGGSAEAHRLVAFLNTAHLPDGDDQLSDDRAGPWLAAWLADARALPAGAIWAAAPDRTHASAPGGAPAVDAIGVPASAPGGAPAVDAIGVPASAPGGVAAIAAATAELLRLREGLRQLAFVNCGGQADPHLVAEAAAVLHSAPLLVDLAGGGEPRLTGAPGSDTARLTVAVAAQAYLAVRARGEWPRLKVCASPDCRWAFLDTTRNRSRRWCDMAGCGNRAKNRTWRERHDVVTSKMI